MIEEETQIEPCDLIIANNYSKINLGVTYFTSSFNYNSKINPIIRIEDMIIVFICRGTDYRRYL
jgi:hypothetical protein